MSQLGSTEALEKYLRLEEENKRLREEIEGWKVKYNEYYNAWQKIASATDSLWHWLDSRENTKTETIKHKIAVLFKWAYMEAEFEDLRSKWLNQSAREAAEKRYPSFHKELIEAKKE